MDRVEYLVQIGRCEEKLDRLEKDIQETSAELKKLLEYLKKKKQSGKEKE